MDRAVVFARIVACVDGSPAGRRATETGVELAGRLRASLTLLHVLPEGSRGRDPELESMVPRPEDGRSLSALLQEAREEAHRRGAAEAQVALRYGEALTAILAYLEEQRADLAVVGTRGLSRGGRLLLGSVSSRLVTDAPCPVLVVRAPGRRGR